MQLHGPSLPRLASVRKLLQREACCRVPVCRQEVFGQAMSTMQRFYTVASFPANLMLSFCLAAQKINREKFLYEDDAFVDVPTLTQADPLSIQALTVLETRELALYNPK